MRISTYTCIVYTRILLCTHGDENAGEHLTYFLRSHSGVNFGSFSSEISTCSAYEATQNPANVHALIVLLIVLSSAISVRVLAAYKYIYTFTHLSNIIRLLIIILYRVQSDAKLILCKYCIILHRIKQSVYIYTSCISNDIIGKRRHA